MGHHQGSRENSLREACRKHKRKFPKPLQIELEQTIKRLSDFCEPGLVDQALALTTHTFWEKVETALVALGVPDSCGRILMSRHDALHKLMVILIQGPSGLPNTSRSQKASAQKNIGRRLEDAAEALKSDPFFEQLTFMDLAKFDYALKKHEDALAKLEGRLYRLFRTFFDVDPWAENPVRYKEGAKEKIANVPGLEEVLSIYWDCELARYSGRNPLLFNLLSAAGLAAHESSLALDDKEIDPAEFSTSRYWFQGKNSANRWEDVINLPSSSRNKNLKPLYGDFEALHRHDTPKPQLDGSGNVLFAQRLISWFLGCNPNGNLPRQEIGNVTGTTLTKIDRLGNVLKAY